MDRRKWTLEEENLLKELYPQKPNRQELEKIFNRPISTIQAKASQLGVRQRPKRKLNFNDIESVMAKIDIDNTGCWNWTGHINQDGYGRITRNNKVMPAYRYVYEIFKGPIPEGMTIDHLCENKACVCPDHLQPRTNRENILLGNNPAAINARKTHCDHGHEYTPENTILRKDGHRRCRECTIEYQVKYRLANKDKQKEYDEKRKLKNRNLV